MAEIRGLFRFWRKILAILGSQASFWHIFPKILGFHKILSGNPDHRKLSVRETRYRAKEERPIPDVAEKMLGDEENRRRNP